MTTARPRPRRRLPRRRRRGPPATRRHGRSDDEPSVQADLLPVPGPPAAIKTGPYYGRRRSCTSTTASARRLGREAPGGPSPAGASTPRSTSPGCPTGCPVFLSELPRPLDAIGTRTPRRRREIAAAGEGRGEKQLGVHLMDGVHGQRSSRVLDRALDALQTPSTRCRAGPRWEQGPPLAAPGQVTDVHEALGRRPRRRSEGAPFLRSEPRQGSARCPVQLPDGPRHAAAGRARRQHIKLSPRRYLAGLGGRRPSPASTRNWSAACAGDDSRAPALRPSPAGSARARGSRRRCAGGRGVRRRPGGVARRVPALEVRGPRRRVVRPVAPEDRRNKVPQRGPTPRRRRQARRAARNDVHRSPVAGPAPRPAPMSRRRGSRAVAARCRAPDDARHRAAVVHEERLLVAAGARMGPSADAVQEALRARSCCGSRQGGGGTTSLSTTTTPRDHRRTCARAERGETSIPTSDPARRDLDRATRSHRLTSPTLRRVRRAHRARPTARRRDAASARRSSALGAGAWGTVSAPAAGSAAPARWTRGGAVVAVKVIHPHLLVARLPAAAPPRGRDRTRVRHENVVRTARRRAGLDDGATASPRHGVRRRPDAARDARTTSAACPRTSCRHVGREIAKALAIHAAGAPCTAT